MVDFDQSDGVVGIEVIRPAREWPLEKVKACFHPGEDETAILDSPSGQATEDRRLAQPPQHRRPSARPTLPTPTRRRGPLLFATPTQWWRGVWTRCRMRPG